MASYNFIKKCPQSRPLMIDIKNDSFKSVFFCYSSNSFFDFGFDHLENVVLILVVSDVI